MEHNGAGGRASARGRYPFMPMTDPELKQLALDFVAGKVYTTQTVPIDLWRMVFLPLFFCTKRQLRYVRMAAATVGEDKTTGQAVNGFPIFFGCRLLKARETRKFVGYIEQVRTMTADFKAQP